MKVRPKVKRVIGLTGTPSFNGLMDLFAEFKCLDMGEQSWIISFRIVETRNSSGIVGTGSL